eukprot:g2193.t1
MYQRYSSIDLRYPWDAGFAADPGLFMPKSMLLFLTVIKISFGILFWFHFFILLYWVLSDAYVLPGSLDGDHYVHHDVMITVLLSLAGVILLLFLYKQSACFVFLLDREPKPTAAGGAGNELSERLSATRTSGYATWILMILFLQGFNWIDSCRWSGNEQSPFNPFLMYGVTGGTFTGQKNDIDDITTPCYIRWFAIPLPPTWLLVIAIQLFVRHLIAMREGLDLINFVDICSLANVSVFIMDEPHHGYYIHGRCPGGKGDCCATEMSYTLDEEARGLLPKRGLTPDHPTRGELQTFEVFTPAAFKEQLFGLYRQLGVEQIQA